MQLRLFATHPLDELPLLLLVEVPPTELPLLLDEPLLVLELLAAVELLALIPPLDEDAEELEDELAALLDAVLLDAVLLDAVLLVPMLLADELWLPAPDELVLLDELAPKVEVPAPDELVLACVPLPDDAPVLPPDDEVELTAVLLCAAFVVDELPAAWGPPHAASNAAVTAHTPIRRAKNRDITSPA